MKIFKTKGKECPVCGYYHDHVTQLDANDEKPKKGDTTTCGGCGLHSIFTDNRGSTRPLTLEEFNSLPMLLRLQMERNRQLVIQYRKLHPLNSKQ